MSSFTAARLIPARDALFAVAGEAGDGFRFYIGAPDSGLAIFVPEGFLTDGPSVPRWLRRLLPRQLARWVLARLGKAAIVHDRLRRDLQFSLIDCDAQFLVALAADGLTWSGRGGLWRRIARTTLRELAFLAVRTNRGRAIL